jgi:hypothetical protein
MFQPFNDGRCFRGLVQKRIIAGGKTQTNNHYGQRVISPQKAIEKDHAVETKETAIFTSYFYLHIHPTSIK